MTVEIVAVGDELVRGITQDTNSHWLAGRIAALGARLTRITLLPDDVKIVAAELRAAADRGATVVVTTGGLGPTTDDRTLEAVALATGRPLEDNDWALDFVASRYRFLHEAGVIADGDLTPERRKMAVLPGGAEPVTNDAGTAPGTIVRGATTILSLPGVPSEMRTMWETVEPAVRDLTQTSGHAHSELVAECNDESLLAPLLAEVTVRNPGVYVKSHASEFVPGGGLRISFVAGDEGLLDAAMDDLRRTLGDAGIGVHHL